MAFDSRSDGGQERTVQALLLINATIGIEEVKSSYLWLTQEMLRTPID
jgi:hypothetical protein